MAVITSACCSASALYLLDIHRVRFHYRPNRGNISYSQVWPDRPYAATREFVPIMLVMNSLSRTLVVRSLYGTRPRTEGFLT